MGGDERGAWRYVFCTKLGPRSPPIGTEGLGPSLPNQPIAEQNFSGGFLLEPDTKGQPSGLSRLCTKVNSGA